MGFHAEPSLTPVSLPVGKDWTLLNDDELLQERVSTLDLHLEGTALEARVKELYSELDAKGLPFHPHCYLADEWFVPTGGTVIGIPFYLAHPRLRKLEEKIMLEVEGQGEAECMKLLRHEAGHAVYNAYRLQKKRKIRVLFGPPSPETPATYQPKPFSKNYVQNLEGWYAQCDPDEDFAETFAVWLDPTSDWRKAYAGWKAMDKLLYVDELMQTFAHKPPLHLTRDEPYHAKHLRTKLATYYRNRRKQLEDQYPDFFDPDLHTLFSCDPEHAGRELAYRYMNKHRRFIVRKVASWTGARKYTVNDLLNSLVERCKETHLRLKKDEHETALDLCIYLTAMVSNYHYTGKYTRKR